MRLRALATAGVRGCALGCLALGACCLHLLGLPALRPGATTGARHRYAVASFLSFEGAEGCWFARSYLDAAAKLGASLRRHAAPGWGEYDMVLLVAGGGSLCARAAGADAGRLERIGWRIVPVEPVCYEPASPAERGFSWVAGNRYEHTCQYTKLHLWRLVEYRRILYLDADTLVVGPLALEALLARGAEPRSPLSLGMEPCLSADGANQTGDACGAGVLLLAPDAHEHRRLLARRGALAHDRFYQEQAYLLRYFSPGNYGRRTFALGGGLVAPVHLAARGGAYSVVHFVGSLKPWHGDFCAGAPDWCARWASARADA